ncbi:cytochrome P450 [Tenggerimyces flavus]|uniref:Cytochrome P450 n=1 Tax=Tenggerimyces flavus TaxID=1708749 RepID=A0ABV7Y848_9ACTN|nr:cytochrome P450 [Tenggerimyces flavus]MBM7785709.1 cytochrome P450 [Tenggerimyces flavus]
MTETPTLPVHLRRDGYEPIPELAKLREEQPVSPAEMLNGGTGWLVTRYDDVRHVLSDVENFSNRWEPSETGGDGSGFLLGYDPPDHTSLRKLLTGEFTVRRLRRLEPRINAIIAEHLDKMEQTGPPADLVEAFALPIPSLVICELLGVPYADRADFQRRSNIRLDLSLPLDYRMEVEAEGLEYMANLVAEQRRDPGEDMIGMLIREHGDAITDRELSGLADLLLLAGHETTSNMLGLGTLLLLQNPEQLAFARDPRNIDQAVEEMLRYLSIVRTVIPRLARTDVELGGQQISAGDVVVCSVPAANRDPVLDPRADEFDVSRKIAAHLAFGHGLHHCLGAPLARMEMRLAFPALFERFPTLRLGIPVENVKYRAFSFVFGVAELPLEW